MKVIFFFVFFCLSCCGSNLLAPSQVEEEQKTFKEIFDIGDHADIIARLAKAVAESKNPSKYLEMFQDIITGGAVIETIDLPEIDSPAKVLEALNKAPPITDEIAAAAKAAYISSKKKYEEATGAAKEEAKKKLKTTAAYSAGSIIKENFYTSDDQFDLEKGEDTLTEEEAAKIVEQVSVIDDLNGENKFQDLTEESSGKTNRQKVIDYLKAGNLALKKSWG